MSRAFDVNELLSISLLFLAFTLVVFLFNYGRDGIAHFFSPRRLLQEDRDPSRINRAKGTASWIMVVVSLTGVVVGLTIEGVRLLGWVDA